jgi:tetratricopeptide (TPR) repeat protein
MSVSTSTRGAVSAAALAFGTLATKHTYTKAPDGSARTAALEATRHRGEELVSRGCLLLTFNRIDEAHAAFSRATLLVPTSGPYHSFVGEALLRARDLPSALAAYRRALRASPMSPLIRRRLAHILFAAGRLEQRRRERIQMLEESVRLHSFSIEAHLYLSRAYLADKQYGKAVNHLSELLSHDDDDAGDSHVSDDDFVASSTNAPRFNRRDSVAKTALDAPLSRTNALEKRSRSGAVGVKRLPLALWAGMRRSDGDATANGDECSPFRLVALSQAEQVSLAASFRALMDASLKSQRDAVQAHSAAVAQDQWRRSAGLCGDDDVENFLARSLGDGGVDEGGLATATRRAPIVLGKLLPVTQPPMPPVLDEPHTMSAVATRRLVPRTNDSLDGADAGVLFDKAYYVEACLSCVLLRAQLMLTLDRSDLALADWRWAHYLAPAEARVVGVRKQLDGHVEVLYTRATAHALNNEPKAMQLLNRAMALRPAAVHLVRLRASIHRKQQHVSEALADLQTALALALKQKDADVDVDSGSGEIATDRGADRRDGRVNGSGGDGDALVSSTQLELGFAFAALAIQRAKRRDYEKAIEALDSAVAVTLMVRSPRKLSFLVSRGDVRRLTLDLKGALGDYETAYTAACRDVAANDKQKTRFVDTVLSGASEHTILAREPSALGIPDNHLAAASASSAAAAAVPMKMLSASRLALSHHEQGVSHYSIAMTLTSSVNEVDRPSSVAYGADMNDDDIAPHDRRAPSTRDGGAANVLDAQSVSLRESSAFAFELEAALYHFSAAIQYHSSISHIYVHRGRVLEHLQRYAEACDDYATARRLDPANEVAEECYYALRQHHGVRSEI